MCPAAPQRFPGTLGSSREGRLTNLGEGSHFDIAEDCWMKSPRDSQVCHEVGHPAGTSGVCPQTRLPTKPGDPASGALRIHVKHTLWSCLKFVRYVPWVFWAPFWKSDQVSLGTLLVMPWMCSVSPGPSGRLSGKPMGILEGFHMT